MKLPTDRGVLCHACRLDLGLMEFGLLFSSLTILLCCGAPLLLAAIVFSAAVQISLTFPRLIVGSRNKGR